MLESIPVVFPEVKYQRCTVHFYRNVFTVTPKTKMKQVTLMLKAIHAQESKEAAQEKAASIAAKLRKMKLLSAAKKVEESVGETLTYMDFPTERWSRIRTNNLTERVNREIRRRTRAIGAFPDGNSALMLVCSSVPDFAMLPPQNGARSAIWTWSIYSRWKLSSRLTRKIHTFDADIYWRMK